MLTTAQKAKCAKLAQALDAGDTAAYKRAEPSLTPEMRGEIWDQRAHVKAQAERAAQAQQAAARPARVEAKSLPRDLDYWASDDVEPIDDDVPDDQPMCGACGGSGKGRDGSVCPICNGRGRIPGEDQPDDRDEDEDE